MAISFIDYGGHEAQNLYENGSKVGGAFNTTHGVPGHHAGINGTISLVADANGVVSHNATITDYVLCEGYFYVVTLPTGSKFITPFILQSSTNQSVSLQFDASGDFRLQDSDGNTAATNAVGLNAGEWYRMKFWCNMLDTTGVFQGHIFEEDGTAHLLASVSGKNFAPNTGTGAQVSMQGGSSSEDVAHFGFYLMNGATSYLNDALGDFTFLYYTGGEKASSTPDNGGDNLDAGTWDDIFGHPAAGSQVYYQGSDNPAVEGWLECSTLSGARSCDKPGPSGDTDIVDYDDAQSFKWWCQGAYNTDVLYSASLQYGNNGGAGSDVGLQALDFASKGAAQGAAYVSANMAEAVVPAVDEFAILGLKKGTIFADYRATMVNAGAVMLTLPGVAASTTKRASLGTIYKTSKEVLAG